MDEATATEIRKIARESLPNFIGTVAGAGFIYLVGVISGVIPLSALPTILSALGALAAALLSRSAYKQSTELDDLLKGSDELRGRSRTVHVRTSEDTSERDPPATDGDVRPEE